METRENLIDLWKHVKPIIFPFDGAASQVYVLDVPRTELERSIDTFCRRAMSASITTLNGYAFGKRQERVCDVTSRAEILRATHQSIIVGTYYRSRTIQFWIWPNIDNATFDAEFVFFGDEFFGDGKDEEALMTSFGSIYSLAEMVRENHPESECALSAQETGDPRDHRGENWTHFW